MKNSISLDHARAAQRTEYHVTPEAAVDLLITVKATRHGIYATLIEMLCEFSGTKVESLVSRSCKHFGAEG